MFILSVCSKYSETFAKNFVVPIEKDELFIDSKILNKESKKNEVKNVNYDINVKIKQIDSVKDKKKNENESLAVKQQNNSKIEPENKKEIKPVIESKVKITKKVQQEIETKTKSDTNENVGQKSDLKDIKSTKPEQEKIIEKNEKNDTVIDVKSEQKNEKGVEVKNNVETKSILNDRQSNDGDISLNKKGKSYYQPFITEGVVSEKPVVEKKQEQVIVTNNDDSKKIAIEKSEDKIVDVNKVDGRKNNKNENNESIIIKKENIEKTENTKKIENIDEETNVNNKSVDEIKKVENKKVDNKIDKNDKMQENREITKKNNEQLETVTIEQVKKIDLVEQNIDKKVEINNKNVEKKEKIEEKNKTVIEDKQNDIQENTDKKSNINTKNIKKIEEVKEKNKNIAENKQNNKQQDINREAEISKKERAEEKNKNVIESKQDKVRVEKEKMEIKKPTVSKNKVTIIKDETENKDQLKPRELIISNGEVIENKYINNVNSNDISSIDLINEIEKNIISREKNSNVTDRKIEIKKGEWTTKDVIEINDSKNTEISKTGAKFKITTKENNNTKKVEELKKIAYKAYKNREYEIAIKYYKAILKIDPKDNLSKLSLATSYHALKQYRQAKPIYVELMQIYPDNENIVSNLISIIVNESPYEAVYLVPSISEKYENSAAIQAQTSMSFAKVKNYKEAIKYIKKALYLDRNNVEYLYNMGVLYDLSGDYAKALSIYRDVAANIDNNSNIKKNKLLERIQVLSNLKK